MLGIPIINEEYELLFMQVDSSIRRYRARFCTELVSFGCLFLSLVPRVLSYGFPVSPPPLSRNRAAVLFSGDHVHETQSLKSTHIDLPIHNYAIATSWQR